MSTNRKRVFSIWNFCCCFSNKKARAAAALFAPAAASNFAHIVGCSGGKREEDGARRLRWIIVKHCARANCAPTCCSLLPARNTPPAMKRKQTAHQVKVACPRRRSKRRTRRFPCRRRQSRLRVYERSLASRNAAFLYRERWHERQLIKSPLIIGVQVFEAGLA